MGVCLSNTTGKEKNKTKKHTINPLQPISKIHDIKISKSDFIFEKSGNFRDFY
jgi:hypothetical protein